MPLKEGDFVLLLAEEGNTYLVRIKDTHFSTHRDSLYLGSLKGLNYGCKVSGKKGSSFYLLKPTIHDFLMKVERLTQVIYPKDIGLILLKLDVGPGKVVLECGGGSGALTSAFAFVVGEKGKVISYEKEAKFQEVAKRNVSRLGLEERVVFKNQEVKAKFEEKDVDAVFLDLKEPWLLLQGAWEALKPGYPIGILVPTTNQISQCLKEMQRLPFVGIEVVELFLRKYKTNPDRIRPEDRMVAHTGYLIFARKVEER